MISTSEFQKGIFIIFETQPWMIVDFEFVAPGKGAAFYRAKLRSLINGNTTERTFKSGEKFEEIEIEKIKAKFLYAHRDKFFFAKESAPSVRFEVEKETIG
ncbi:MAG: elongation factor P, partial [bacterium]|nr:elongation factor P [bacterium]